MAIPVTTDFYAAQVVVPSQTSLPEDGATNTFYFRNDGLFTQGIMADAIEVALQDFYFTVLPSGTTVGNFFSSGTVKNNWQVRVYDLGLPAPREPILRAIVANVGGSNPLPTEVAACLSYVADRNLPRNRGRIYLGPLGTNALVTSAGRVLVSPAFRTALRESAARLQGANGQSISWHLYSTVANQMKLITGGWVDDAFDTQRRRGTAPTVRETWGPDPGI